MVVDSSAILAVYFQEPTADWVSTKLDEASTILMSTVNLAEVLMRFRDRKPTIADKLQRQLLATRMEFVPPDIDQAVVATEARFRFPINFGDCFAYALAKTRALPLLTLDQDFRSLDLTLVMPE